MYGLSDSAVVACGLYARLLLAQSDNDDFFATLCQVVTLFVMIVCLLQLMRRKLAKTYYLVEELDGCVSRVPGGVESGERSVKREQRTIDVVIEQVSFGGSRRTNRPTDRIFAFWPRTHPSRAPPLQP